MPGLVLFHRKWLVAGDLLLFPFAIEAILRLIWIIAAGIISWYMYQDDSGCIDEKYTKKYFSFLLVDLVLNIPLCAAITWFSAQGSVLKEGKRAYLPAALYVKVALFSFDLFLTIIGIWLGFFSDDLCVCILPIAAEFIRVTSICLIIYIFIIVAGIFLAYNPLGSLRFWINERDNNSITAKKFLQKSEKIWAVRLKLFCCCLKFNSNNNSIYREIATFFASFFESRDLDLIPSDILTGLIIISKKHASEKKRLKFMDSLCSYGYINSNDPLVPLWMNAENASYYLRYAKYTYGWPLLVSTNPFKLMSTAFSRCCGCSNSIAIGSDDCCYCNITALKKASSTNADIIYASYCTAVYEPAFFVAVDQKMLSVVVGIRGTFSLSDILTDFDAEIERVNILEKVQNFFCHRGVLRSARFVHNKLNELDILRPLMRDNPDYNLVLTGHSLGGSIAAVLGLMLRPQFPDIQCYCYGPLASLSPRGIRTTYDFVLSVVAGDDIAPRLCVTACEELRADIIQSLKDCVTPKYKVIAQAFVRFLFNREIFKSAGKVKQVNPFFTNDQTSDDCEKGGYDSLESDCSKDSRLYAPGRILYLERTPEGVRSLWKTGFHFQRIIITPYLFRDHQPRVLQILLKEVCDSEKSPSRRRRAQAHFLEGPSDSIDSHVVYAQSVDLSDEFISL